MYIHSFYIYGDEGPSFNIPTQFNPDRTGLSLFIAMANETDTIFYAHHGLAYFFNCVAKLQQICIKTQKKNKKNSTDPIQIIGNHSAAIGSINSISKA